MDNENWVAEQTKTCETYGAIYVSCPPESIIGIAADTYSANIPINGLRHPIEGGTSGWYLWSGNTLSSADDFFQPIHAKHLEDRCPEVIRFLGLPPGYRFLIANKYVDVWFDKTLLDV